MRLVVARQSPMPKRQSELCGKCGGTKPLGDRCPACRAAYKKAHPESSRAATGKWRAANKEKVKAYSEAHRHDVREAGRRWDLSHKAERAAQSAKRANTPEFKARRRARYAANPERMGAYYKKWRDANPDKVRALSRGASIRRHGLTRADYDVLLAAQGGVCKICSVTEPGGYGTWHIDHDHACCPGNRRSCGRCVRGLLCHKCNLLLGLSGDSPDVLRRAIAYLESWKRLRVVAG